MVNLMLWHAIAYECVFFWKIFCISQMILYFHYTDLTSNPWFGNYDDFSKSLLVLLWCLNPIQDGPFRGCSQMGGVKSTLPAP